ncbi:MAG TPA: hypothetical protein VGX76_20690 [Pirellulales bacterium]|jgi:hypothetical protein|nr:hypothetical protein [Pirellulales bacterium]
MDGQPRITDLVPRPNAAFAAIFAAGLAAIAALEGLYLAMPALAPMTTDGRVASFDLDSEGSLAVWFSCGTLELAALTAILIYGIRRHTPGTDRRGQRLWLWAAACWLVMSLDECGSVHEAFKELMSKTTGHRLLGDGTIWWVAAYGLVLGVVGLRLLWAMRRCAGAIVALFGTAVAYAVAVLAELTWILPRQGTPGVMLEEGCEMLGNLFLWLSLGLFARHAARAAEAAARVAATRRHSIALGNRHHHASVSPERARPGEPKGVELSNTAANLRPVRT